MNKKPSFREMMKVMKEKSGFTQKLSKLMTEYTISEESDLEELDKLLEPFFALDPSKAIEIKFQGKIFNLKRIR